MIPNLNNSKWGATILGCIFGGVLHGGELAEPVVFTDKAPVAEAPCKVCNIFQYSTLYENESAHLIQRLNLLGRYNGQYIDINPANVPAHGERAFWHHRRLRAGLGAQFLNDFEFKGEFNLADGGTGNSALAEDRLFNDFEEIYIKWKPNKDFYVTGGKQKQRINREKTESAKRILTVERAPISNEVSVNEYAWGLATGFKLGNLNHEFGIFTNGVDDDWGWADFRGRELFTYRVNYDWNDHSRLFFDFMHTDTGPNEAQDRARSDYEQVFALGSESKWDRLGLLTDLIYGAENSRFPKTDTWGLVFLPSYDLTSKLQLVTRYAYMDSGRLHHPQRHTGIRNIDQLHTWYLGGNYRICRDRFKFLGGVEFANGTNHDGLTPYKSTTWMVGVRTYF